MRKGFDKRILVGVVLVLIVVAGVFAYYQSAAAPQVKTETVRIDIKAVTLNGVERHIFDPATITVHKGDHIVLIVANTDDLPHGILIHYNQLDLSTGTLKGGESAKLEFDANTTGAFNFLCAVPSCAPDHDQMVGQLIVAA
jgi:plastocyanin